LAARRLVLLGVALAALDPDSIAPIEGIHRSAAHQNFHAFAGTEYERRVLDFLAAVSY
jgi:hypothetical protein